MQGDGIIGAINLINTNALLHPSPGIWGFVAKSGANHALKDLRNINLGSTDIDKIDQGLTGTSNRYDIKRKNPDGYIEYKSYKENYTTGKLADIGNGRWSDFEQFLAYLKQPEVIDMQGTTLEYVFDVKKTPNVVNIKSQFQKLMCSNCEAGNTTTPKTLSTQGEQIFNTIWNSNLGLRQSLFGSVITDFTLADNIIKPIARAEFISMTSSTTNSFYNFIKVR